MGCVFLKVKVYGTLNCPRCEIVKQILFKKGVDFEYIIFTACDRDERKKIMENAKDVGIESFPIILKDDVIIDIKEF